MLEVLFCGKRISVVIEKAKRYFLARARARVYQHKTLVLVVVITVIVSMFIVAVLSSDDKLETFANDCGHRTKNIEYIGKDAGDATWTEK